MFNFWLCGFLISAFLGVAVSFSKIYLVHFFLVLSPFFLLRQNLGLSSIRSFLWENWVFFFWIGYLSLTLLWVPDTKSGGHYLLMVSLGVLTALSASLIQDERKALRILCFLLLASLALGLLESVTTFRYPLSKYSSVLHLFRKEALESDASEPYPTSFFWTANNFSFVLLVALPFYRLLRQRWQEAVLILLSMFLVLRTSSRGILALMFFYLVWRIGELLLRGKNLRKHLVKVLGILVVFVPLAYFGLSNDNFLEIRTVHDVIQKQVTFYSTLLSGGDVESLPRTRREEMLNQASKIWREHKFFGAGAGQLQGKFGQYAGAPLNVSTPHQYWFELLTYGGVFFVTVIFLGFLQWMLRLRTRGDEISHSTLEAFILFILGAPACSTLVYFFPAWLFLGLVSRLSRVR